MAHDPLKDFRGITNLASTPIQLVVSANSPVQSVAELVALVRSQPGRHNFASSSNGTPGHLAGEVFKAAAKLDATHIPYKGSAPALTDVIGGQVTYMLDSMPSSISLVKGGKLRVLAVTSPERSQFYPALPTIGEGQPGYSVELWWGVLAPAGTPAPLVDKLNAAVAKIVRNPEVQASLRDQGFTPASSTPREFQTMINADIDRYTALTESIGLRAD
ncbi:hypothetical protein G6F65_014710 [Rhizopus arrhizus]|nr:hypothetical protein G6F65_014710 [Rhizopus arrhizus]